MDGRVFLALLVCLFLFGTRTDLLEKDRSAARSSWLRLLLAEGLCALSTITNAWLDAMGSTDLFSVSIALIPSTMILLMLGSLMQAARKGHQSAGTP